MHAGPGGGATVETYLDALRFGLPDPPRLAHRLDRDTSGCLVLGRHRKALAKLGRLFAAGRVEKVYWAVLRGVPLGGSGTIDLALAKRSTEARGWWMRADKDGQTAVTDWRVLGTGGGLAWVEFRPRTGRTHQIRVHALEGLGLAVLGDPVYGERGPGRPPLHLHARAITLPLAATKPPITVTAPVPPHMTAALAACDWPGEIALGDEGGGEEPANEAVAP